MSPCITVAIGDSVAIVCMPGAYRELVRAACPHCCLGRARTIHATREVHSGYCAPDMICGRCGQFWSYDWLMEGRLPRMATGEREENRTIVAALKAKLGRASRAPRRARRTR